MSSSNQVFNNSGLAKHIIDFKFKITKKYIYSKELLEPIILNPNKKYKLTFLECNTSNFFYAYIVINDTSITHFGYAFNGYNGYLDSANFINNLHGEGDENIIFEKFQFDYKDKIPSDIWEIAITLFPYHSKFLDDFEFELKFAIEEIPMPIPESFKTSSNKICCVCYESTNDFTPCYHYVCNECMTIIKNPCPYCRGNIVEEVEEAKYLEFYASEDDSGIDYDD